LRYQHSNLVFMTQAELDFYKHKDESGKPIRWSRESQVRPLALPNTNANSHRAEWNSAVRRTEFAFFGEVRRNHATGS
jgi:hypothetical protein